MTLLDINVLSELMKPAADPGVTDRARVSLVVTKLPPPPERGRVGWGQSIFTASPLTLPPSRLWRPSPGVIRYAKLSPMNVQDYIVIDPAETAEP